MEDLVQETFVRALAARHRFRYGTIQAWLSTILIRARIDQVRLRSSQTTTNVNEETFETITMAGEAIEMVQVSACDEAALMRQLPPWLAEVLADIPDEHRVPFLLRTFDELTPPQIAQVLEMSPGNARVRIHRARRHLQEALGA